MQLLGFVKTTANSKKGRVIGESVLLAFAKAMAKQVSKQASKQANLA